MARQDANKVVVIGAGIVGVSTALWLQRDGHDVTLIDRLEPGEATSFGNGGVLASCAIVPVTGPGLLMKAPKMLFSRNGPLFLKWGYVPKLLPWLRKYLSHANAADTKRIAAALAPIIGDSLADHQALAAGTSAQKYIVPSDYMYVYKDRAAFEEERFSWDIRREHGFEWQELEGEALRERAPVLGPDIGFGVLLGNHGRITDPGAYVKALAKHLTDNGGHFVRAAISGFDLRNGKLHGVLTDAGEIDCDMAVVTAGAWSAKLLKMVGQDVPLEAERGYHIELWNPSYMPDLPLLHAGGKFAITPMDGRLRLAGIVEFGGLEAPPSEAPFNYLERKCRETFPDLSWERTERWMGHRPATPDSIPVIGEVATARGVFAGFGHHHVGLTGGPKTGRLLAQVISGNSPNIDMRAYRTNRY